jgi:acyl-CoA thioester hydrolase
MPEKGLSHDLRKVVGGPWHERRQERGSTMEAYRHKVHYYETDQMGVVHHSNYIRWFEESRTDMMERFGYGYDKAEAHGIMIPVLEVSCKYHAMVRYGEEVFVTPRIEQFNGVRMTLSYRVTDAATGELRTTGESRHCFVDGSFRPVAVQKVDRELYERFNAMHQADAESGGPLSAVGVR